MTAVAMANERREHTFLWFVDNYSYCWHERGEMLASPEFVAYGLDDTVWNLKLFPRNVEHGKEDYISLILRRSENDNGPEDFLLNFELSLVSVDGSALCSKEKSGSFHRNCEDGEVLVEVAEVLFRRKAEYLPQNTLSVRCKLWTGEGGVREAAQTCARTRIGVRRISFLHAVENFSSFESITVPVQSHSKQCCFLSSHLYLTDGLCCERKLFVEIEPSDGKYILCQCQISLLAQSGNKIDFCDAGNRLDATRKNIYKMPLTLSRKEIMNKRSDYLVDGKLSLLVECTFSAGIEFQEIEESHFEISSVTVNGRKNDVPDKRIHHIAEKLIACAGALDDLKKSYSNQLFTDVELKTKTKSFPAHKIVVCSRSPVFKTMMSSDMKEKITNCIRIDDLEDHVVQKLLLFLYSDDLEDLQWKDALQLYYAADKYQVERLKLTCSSFLVDNLNASNACELLLFADTHADTDLKEIVEEYILKHEYAVYCSDEWVKQMEANAFLLLKTMHLKYKRRKTGNLVK